MQRNVVAALVCALVTGCLPAAFGPPAGPVPEQPLAAVRLLGVSAGTRPAGTRPAGRAVWPARVPTRPAATSVLALPRQPITRFRTSGRVIALTFDDGPDPRWTPTVLDLLRQYHARAVFCVVGLHVAANPELVRRIAREGHVLCDHTWTHDEHLARRPATVVNDEIRRTASAITRAAGVAPRYYRAPGGQWSPSMLAVARACGLAPLGWAIDPADWSRPGTEAIIGRVLAAATPGAVVLMHDGYGRRAESVAALRVILASLAARGYRFGIPP
jgi:peptidoglycan-N-acetylglucosamine deacetylase